MSACRKAEVRGLGRAEVCGVGTAGHVQRWQCGVVWSEREGVVLLLLLLLVLLVLLVEMLRVVLGGRGERVFGGAGGKAASA